MEMCWFLSGIAILTEWFYFVRAHDCTSSESIVCRDKLDNLMSDGRKHDFMDDEKQLDVMCRKQHEAMQCIKTYAESCLPVEQQEVFNVLTQGSDQFFHDFCSDGSAMRKDYLKYSKCINSISLKLDECMEEYEISQKLLDEQETETKVLRKKTCCIYFKNIRCSSNATAETCGENAAEVVTKLWSLLGGTYLNNVCEPFRTEDLVSCTPVSKSSRITEQTNVIYLLLFFMWCSYLSLHIMCF